jgi:hypothetical protein
MLAGAAVCALSTAPALAAHTPGIHLAGMFKTAMKVTTGINHSKTAMHEATKAVNFTSTVDLSGTISSGFNGLLYAYTWQTASCATPPNQKQKYSKPAIGKVKGTTTVSENSCGGTSTFFGPDFTNKKHQTGNASFTGTLSAKKFEGYNLLLNENVTLTVD